MPLQLSQGDYATFVTYGEMTLLAKDAATYFHEEYDVGFDLFDLRALSPLNLTAIEASLARTGRLIVLHEGRKTHGFGAELTLHETPGHLARLGEDDAALSILCLAVLFLWDCWVLPARGRPAVFVSHDEYGIVDTRGDDLGLAERFALLGVADDAERAI